MITTKTISRIKTSLSYLHATLFLIMVTPLMCGVGEVEPGISTFVVVAECFLIAIPVIVTKKAQMLSKNLVIYLMICLCTLASVIALGYVVLEPDFSNAYGICYVLAMVAETVLMCIVRLVDRLQKADFIAPKVPSIFDRPKVAYVWYFVVMYMIGILFNSKMLCDIAFWVAIVYMLTAFCYEYVEQTGGYIKLHNRTKGIPQKRLYGISLAMALIFLMVCLAGILPSIIMSGYRQYTDVRHWFDDMPAGEVLLDSEKAPEMSGVMSVDPMMELIREDAQNAEPSKIADALFWLISIICIIVLIYGLVQFIRQIFKNFRNAYDENGDIIEEIKDDEAFYKEGEVYIREKNIDSEAMRIRRKYKKTIKKHRKDLPAAYETPNEIEHYAGLLGKDGMKQLHDEYENARYGKI